jgi:hypothetical protein
VGVFCKKNKLSLPIFIEENINADVYIRFSLSGILSFLAEATRVRIFYPPFLVFHVIHMKSPSAKQGFCTGLQTYFELLKSPLENGCEVLEQLFDISNRRSLQTSTTNFLGAYSAWGKAESII